MLMKRGGDLEQTWLAFVVILFGIFIFLYFYTNAGLQSASCTMFGRRLSDNDFYELHWRFALEQIDDIPALTFEEFLSREDTYRGIINIGHRRHYETMGDLIWLDRKIYFVSVSARYPTKVQGKYKRLSIGFDSCGKALMYNIDSEELVWLSMDKDQK